MIVAFVVPGSTQLRAGQRLIGGVAVGVWAVIWVLLGVAVAGTALSPTTGFAVIASTSALAVARTVALCLGVFWLAIGLHTALLLVRRPARRSLTGVAALIVALTAALLSAGIPLAAASVLGTAQRAEAELFVPSPDVVLANGRLNILLLGTDAGPDREGRRTDSISVVSIDAATGRMVLVGVPRELQQVPLPAGSPLLAESPSGVYDCGNDCQLGFLYQRVEEFSPELYPDASSRHSSPGVEAVRDAVEGALGLSIPYYVQVDMLGFSTLIDELGGVDLTVAERLPIDGDENGVGVSGYIEPGMQHLDGTTALWYARSRQSTSDYDRMARQRQLEQVLLAEKNPAVLGLAFARVIDRDPGLVRTDLTEGALARLLALAPAARSTPISTAELTPPAVDPKNPDYTALRHLVAAALDGG
ncbi:MAG: polyisoprenyl-teichoic acid--peptidoglycan teichoic acid transferase [Subtercola sp.]|nr:polyisoprenyl-teichoic acid--peptidoglycan teichoic acid transferase [Subtercola sp.]